MKRILIVAAALSGMVLFGSWAFGQGLLTVEQQAMNDTLHYALEKNSLNQGSEWVNPDTGHAGVVAPTRTFSNSQGQPCREFVKTIIIGGREEQGYGTACRQPDGSWQIVAPEQLSDRPATVYVHTPADRYYAYPADVYARFPIYLSFSYVYRHGDVFRGSYHISGRDYRHRHPAKIQQRVIVVPPRYDHYRRHDDHGYKGKYKYRDDWRDDRGKGRKHGSKRD